VAAAADIIAAGLLEGLQGRGLRVPEDVAVMGYDNLPISRLVRPRLTTIDQGLSEKVRAVMAMIHGREENLVKIVDPHLVLRESA
jgi:LacI family transcriptional regulator